MPTPVPVRSAADSSLTWLLALALVLSVGVNLYCLMPDYQSTGDPAAGRRLALADDEEQDSAWTLLNEELRHARQQLADCQDNGRRRPTPPLRGR